MPDSHQAIWRAGMSRIHAITHGGNTGHPTDESRLRWELAELARAGVRPSEAEAEDMLVELFPDDRPFRRAVMKQWVKLVKNQYHRFRLSVPLVGRWRPFALQHSLERDQGLRPSVKDRVAVEARRRLEEVLVFLDSGSRDDYVVALIQLDHSLEQVRRCRSSILGQRSVDAYLDYLEFDSQREWGPLE